MSSVNPDDRESPFKLKCKESTLSKMRVMSQLSEALDIQSGLQFASLIPVGNIISSIVSKNRPAFNDAVSDLKRLITQRKRNLTLQDIPVIAEINFLEGFDSFISYIHTGPSVEGEEVDGEEEDTNTQSLDSSIRSSPAKVNITPVAVKAEQVTKKLDDFVEKDKPSRKSSRRGIELPTLSDGHDEAETVMPTRKSIRSQIYDGEFNCVFNGCTAVFNSAMSLTLHAEECEHKCDLQLVFRCSGCKRSFTSDKAVKGHIGHFLSKCPSATINIGSEKNLSEKSGEEKVKSVCVRRSWNARKSQVSSIGDGINTPSQVVECAFKGCTYSNDNFELIYAHVKNAHTDYNTTFKCLKCGDTRVSGKAMKNHFDQCTDAKVELKLSKKDHEINQWDIKLRTCPIQACNFISPAARQLALHFKKAHSDSKLSFQCCKCSEASASVKAVINHCKTCIGSEPEVLVNGKTIGKKRLSRQSMSTPTMTMRKRGRPPLNSSSKKRSKKGAEVDVADMPVLEMIEVDDDGEMAVVGDEDEEDERVDPLSTDEAELARNKEEYEGDE